MRRVDRLRIGIHASAGCLERHGNPASLLSLRHRPLIGPDRHSADLRRLVDAGPCDAYQHFSIASDHHIAQMAALKAVLGFGLCPTQIAKSHSLVHVLPHDFRL